ncbi:MAG: SsrA-binding protein SmpB [Francisellaceae bacterium]|jgi:SsrA-binding protein|nr:SsrA-binding protein SmpB [Francisellaceae bacterium]MBT6208075.1 SsrA-binding protein SmpB [Francisellaceae bacterium]MBT6538787.1 SsrA-binding protein SmpB [Francisellaceae bacterium]
MSKKSKTKASSSTIAVNKRARYDYEIKSDYEAGIVLQGWELKSIRQGKVQLSDSYVVIRKGEAFLLNVLVSPLISACTHVIAEPSRTRKLLLHRKELSILIGHVERKGHTLIPLQMYWKKNIVKLRFGLAQGKKHHDKRSCVKDREWARDKARILKRG